MATYKGIKGVKVQSKASDPTASEADGTVWYNTATSLLKYAIQGAGAWASGGAVNTGRGSMGCTGIQTAAIIFGGLPSSKNNSETYNGSSWTNTPTLNTGVQYNIGFGTSTAAINTNGIGPSGSANSAVTEIWNGSTWTTTTALPTGRQSAMAANQGTTTAGCIFGGVTDTPFPPTLTYLNLHEQWDGSAWSEQNNLNTARKEGGGGGTQGAAFAAGGNTGSPSALVELWNGTCWVVGNTINTARQNTGSAGTTTSALLYSGDGPVQITEKFDGTSWTEVADLADSHQQPGKGTGLSGGSALCASGSITSTEEWTDPVYTIKTVTVS